MNNNKNDFILPWNGTWLGNYDKDNIIRKIKHYPYDCYEINMMYKNTTVNMTVAMHSYGSSIPCIIDELAPLYGQCKIGTHTIAFGKKNYVMYHIGCNYVTLANYNGPISEDMRQDVRDIFTFRLIMGQNQNNENSIIINNECLMSLRNNYIPERLDVMDISSSVVRDWSLNNFAESVKRMQLHHGGSRLRSLTQSVIRKLDSELIWFDGLIMSRLTQLS